MTRPAPAFALLLCLIGGTAFPAEFPRPAYGFIAHTPDDWKVIVERDKDDELHLQFVLPKVWSALEKQTIENSVSIRADRTFKSLAELVAVDDQRIANTLVSKEPVKASTPADEAFILVTTHRGLEYKTYATYRRVNGVCYVISFTASHGTFDVNLPRYREFLENLKFIAPPTAVR